MYLVRASILVLVSMISMCSLCAGGVDAKGPGVTLAEISNSKAMVPSMGDGAGDPVQFRKGLGVKSTAVPYSKIVTSAVGTISNEPVGAAMVVWNTGGSGNWRTLLLFERNKKGNLYGRKSFSSYLSSADKMKIQNSRVFVHLTDPEEVAIRKKEAGYGKFEGNGWVSFAKSDFSAR